MLQLPNGCRCSIIAVSPKNWKTLKKITSDWVIHYRFYAPGSPGKQVLMRNMNRYKTPEARRAATNALVQSEIRLLMSGYNPIIKQTIEPTNQRMPLNSYSPLFGALRSALDRLTVEPKTKKDISLVIDSVERSATKIGLGHLELGAVKRSHIKDILDNCRNTNPRFTDNTFNHYHKYLRILFTELVEMDAVEFNFMRDIKKKAPVKRVRKTLTDEQRKWVDSFLRLNHPSFHRFLHIFFHSGARITELMKVKVKDVDLQHQRYKTTIIKGKAKREVERVIKDIAVPLWIELLEGASLEDYIFSYGLCPGPDAIRPDQITKRWYRLVKEHKHVKKNWPDIADFYALKHLNTTEVVDKIGEEAAARLNEHTSTKMTAKVYDIRNKQRELDEIKRVRNQFAADL